MGRKRHHSASTKPRILLREWLISMVDSKKISGLLWYDEKEGIVQIPWKHGSKHNFNKAQDSTLFREWAIHTNRYRVGEAPDCKKWKANFRCALNSLKKHIHYEQKKSKSRGDEAYRLYRLLPCASNAETNNQTDLISCGANVTTKRKRCGSVRKFASVPLNRLRYSTGSGSSSGVSCDFEDDDLACNSDISSPPYIEEVELDHELYHHEVQEEHDVHWVGMNEEMLSFENSNDFLDAPHLP